MSSAAQTPDDVELNPMTDLTGFQRDLLVAITTLEADPSGQEIKTRWETQNDEETTHGRLYPNLDTLVKEGYVERGAKNRRTNYYRLTEKGEEEYSRYAEFVGA